MRDMFARLSSKYLISNDTYDCLWVCGQLTFPYGQNPPSGTFQLCLLFPVALDRPVELLLPELRAGLRHGCIGASFMPVPEAAMNEDDSPVFWENDVRLTRQARNMQPETEARSVKQAAQHQLGFRVLAPDAGHVPAAMFF